jgi:hypothetical protein
MDTGKVRSFPILYTLESPGHTVRAYKLDTGEQIYQQLLDPTVKYANLDVQDELNQVVIQSVKSTLAGNLVFDCTVIDNDGFKPWVRWQVWASRRGYSTFTSYTGFPLRKV